MPVDDIYFQIKQTVEEKKTKGVQYCLCFFNSVLLMKLLYILTTMTLSKVSLSGCATSDGRLLPKGMQFRPLEYVTLIWGHYQGSMIELFAKIANGFLLHLRNINMGGVITRCIITTYLIGKYENEETNTHGYVK